MERSVLQQHHDELHQVDVGYQLAEIQIQAAVPDSVVSCSEVDKYDPNLLLPLERCHGPDERIYRWWNDLGGSQPVHGVDGRRRHR